MTVALSSTPTPRSTFGSIKMRRFGFRKIHQLLYREYCIRHPSTQRETKLFLSDSCSLPCLDASVKSPGFYTEQYVQHHQQHQMIAATSLSHPHYSMGPVEPITVMPMGNHDYSTALSALYEHSAHFPLKSEPRQHMPPTPPGE